MTRRFPLVLQLLEDGASNLSTIGLLAHLLTADNHEHVLAAARHRSKREVEVQVAALRPLPAVPSVVRRLPAVRPSDESDSTPTVHDTVPEERTQVAIETTRVLTSEPGIPQVRAAVIAPVAPERYRVQLTVSRETHDRLRRVQSLLRHSVPDGDLAALFDRALSLLLADLERKKFAATNRPGPMVEPKPRSRHVPATVRRQVWDRDGGQCAFVGTRGRCRERGLLEFHHVIPFADGGSCGADNIQLRCRAHNAFESTQWMGPSLIPDFAEPETGTTRSGPS